MGSKLILYHTCHNTQSDVLIMMPQATWQACRAGSGSKITEA
jgi:hypothetical protein